MNTKLYTDETPILESVFVDLAPNAISIQDLATSALDGADCLDRWYWQPLSYRELLEWTQEGGMDQ
jgi:hypothetical protein